MIQYAPSTLGGRSLYTGFFQVHALAFTIYDAQQRMAVITRHLRPSELLNYLDKSLAERGGHEHNTSAGVIIFYVNYDAKGGRIIK